MGNGKTKSTYPDNGLVFGQYYLPEEIVILILSYVDPKEILRVSLVCKRWHGYVRSKKLWALKYERTYRKTAKHLPWFVYYTLFATNFFNTNLLKNGNGVDRFAYWDLGNTKLLLFDVENIPAKANPLPANIPEFNNAKCCFVISSFNNIPYETPCKSQLIYLCPTKCCEFILENYKPHIYVSEWITARRDCESFYKLKIYMGVPVEENSHKVEHTFEMGQGGDWIKKEILIENYPENTRTLLFTHMGWDRGVGNFGIKMAGGVVKVLFESVQFVNNDFKVQDEIKKLKINSF